MEDSKSAISIEDVRAAAGRIRQNGVHRTPVLTCETLDRMSGARLFFKCENFQKIGAFKFRGASNAILSLTENETKRGVVTMSSGNHAAAVALAARLRGANAYIAMPETAPAAKRRAVEGYGGMITFAGANINEVNETAFRIQQETGAVMIHPFDDPRVIAGQGTVALELLEDRPDLDAIIGPVSGGGLMSGTCIAASAMKPGIELFGAEPAGADDAYRSLRAGRRLTDGPRDTIADGLRATLSERTFAILSRHLREILTVSEEQIVAATKEIWQRMKIVVEPSGAVPLAAVLAYPDRFANKRTGVIVSGGNLDIERLPW
jgi:threonine dehydratase